ncbi:MAG TPA: hypothetical protein VGE97_09790 [Nitrososphaera sp.]|jgi:hypothetical protein
MTETTAEAPSEESPQDQAYQAFISSGHTDTRAVKEAFMAGYEAGSQASSSNGGSEVPADLNR